MPVIRDEIRVDDDNWEADIETLEGLGNGDVDTDASDDEKTEGLRKLKAKLQEFRRAAARKSIIRASANATHIRCGTQGSGTGGAVQSPVKVWMGTEEGRVLLSPEGESSEAQPKEEGAKTPKEPAKRRGQEEEIARCCTFGAQPVVTVSSPNKVERRLSIKFGPIRLGIKLELSLTPLSASFMREGLCWQGPCEDEKLIGTIDLQVKLVIHFTAEAPIEIDGIIVDVGVDAYRGDQLSIPLDYELECNP